MARMRNWPIAQHGRRERRFALAAAHGQALAGDRLLVDRRHAFEDLAVDGNDLAGIDDDDVADGQFARGDRNDLVVAHDPGVLGLKLEQFRDRSLARPPR